MKKLAFLLVFLVAGWSSMLAQSGHYFDNVATMGALNNKGIVAISTSSVTDVDGVNVTGGGTISFQTAPLSSLFASGGSFSGGSFTYSSVPNVGSASTSTVAGSLTVLGNSPDGTMSKYLLQLVFSGVDSTGAAFSGTSVQILTFYLNSGGNFTSSVQADAGDTTITYN